MDDPSTAHGPATRPPRQPGPHRAIPGGWLTSGLRTRNRIVRSTVGSGMKRSSGVPSTVGATLSGVAGAQAWRRAGDGSGLGAALRSTARVSFGFFAVSLVAPWGPTNRRVRLAFGGSHLTHGLLIARYLGRHDHRRPTGPGALPAVIEIPGGVLGYVMVVVMVNNALDDRPRGAVDDLASGYLAALFGFDFLNAATPKGSLWSPERGPPSGRTGLGRRASVGHDRCSREVHWNQAVRPCHRSSLALGATPSRLILTVVVVVAVDRKMIPSSRPTRPLAWSGVSALQSVIVVIEGRDSGPPVAPDLDSTRWVRPQVGDVGTAATVLGDDPEDFTVEPVADRSEPSLPGAPTLSSQEERRLVAPGRRAGRCASPGWRRISLSAARADGGSPASRPISLPVRPPSPPHGRHRPHARLSPAAAQCRRPVVGDGVIELAQGIRRFRQLQRAVPGISQRMLTLTLRRLECDSDHLPDRPRAGRRVRPDLACDEDPCRILNAWHSNVEILAYPRRSPTTGGRIRTGTSVPV